MKLLMRRWLSSKKTMGFAIVFLLMTAAALYLPKPETERAQPPAVAGGVLDSSSWDFEQDGIISLKGEWEFFWGKLLTAKDFDDNALHGQLVQIPNVWTNYQAQDGRDYPGEGYATYRLKVRTNGNDSRLALKIPDISTAAIVLIDDRIIATSGQVAEIKNEAEAEFAPQVVYFEPHAPEFELIVQVSNYLYDRGGMWYAMELGTDKQIARLRENGMAANLILLGIFLFMGLYHLAIYMMRRKEKIALYFSIGCLIGAMRLLAVDDMFIRSLFSDVRIEVIIGIIYFTYYGGVTALTLYLRELYPQEIHRYATRAVVAFSGAFMLTVVLLPVNLFTHMIRYYHLFMIVLGLYLIYAVLLAVWRKRDGSGLQFMGISIFVSTIFHDILFNLFYISEWINSANTAQILQKQIVLLGLFVLVFVQSIILAKRFSTAFQTVESMSERLLSLDRLKDEFLVNTSHELKTPLHGMINLTQSMIEGSNGPINEVQRQKLSVVVSVARRLTNLIQDIMDFSKLKNNEIKLHKRSVSIQAVLRANMDIFHNYIGDKPIELKAQLSEELPAVHADENRVSQILYNLIGNAIKFTERGEIVISAEHQGDWVKVHVMDTGIGIPEKKQEMIFQSFEQVGSTVSREYGGAGLGLSISRQLVELNGGELSVHSKPGEGSTFSFTLPVSKEQPVVHTEVQPFHYIPASPVLSPEPSHPFKEELPYTILAVDDDPANLQVILSVFAQEPYRIILAKDGMEALEMLNHTVKVDLVLLDVMMPKLSGYEVTRKIRERYTISELPVLLVTVKNEPEDMVNGFSAGANDFLVKPFYTHELKARVRTLLELKLSVEEAIHAELDFLRAQIKPHFLYNALNTIVAICPRDPKKASYLLTELSHYLRGSFDFEKHEKFVSLEQELELVASYVAIEKARFGDRLQVIIDRNESVNISIPPLSIQPLVENSIRHGAMKRIDGGWVKVTVCPDADDVVISVEDNGVGLSVEHLNHLFANEEPKRGVGLNNIHQRLLRIYGVGLSVESVEGQGTKVTIRIPTAAEI